MTAINVLATGNSISFAASISNTFDRGSGAKPLIIMLGTNTSSNPTNPTTSTWNGVAMVQGTQFTNSTAGNKLKPSWLFSDASVAAGSHPLVQNYLDGNGKPAVTYAVYTGVDETAGISGEVNGTLTSLTPTFTIASAAGDVALVLMTCDGTNAITPGAGVTVLYDSGASLAWRFLIIEKAGAASTALQLTTTGVTPSWAYVGVSIKSDVAAAATATTLTGPSSGTVSVASSNFTVGANGAITGTVIITPSDAANGGTFSPTTVSINTASPTGTFTYTPASTGVKTISTTNNGSLTNPTAISYTSNAAGGSAVGAAALIYQQMIGQSNV